MALTALGVNNCDLTLVRLAGATLAPQDAELLQVGGDTPETKRKFKTAREKPTTPVSWLRRHTEYISNEYDQNPKKLRTDSIESRYLTLHTCPKATSWSKSINRWRRLCRVGHATLRQADKQKRTQEEIMDAIESGFESAKQTPVHPTDPSLKPVEVMPECIIHGCPCIRV